MKRLIGFTAVMAMALTSVLAFGTARSQAGLIGGLLGCSGVTYTQPFTQWGDRNSYFLATGGSFEGNNSWGLAGGAQIVAENEPYHLNSYSDSHSLLLPPGSSVTTPAMCLAVLSPHMRLVGQVTGGVSRARRRLRERVARPDQAAGLGQHRPLELVGRRAATFPCCSRTCWRSRISARQASSSASRRSAPRRCRSTTSTSIRCSTSRASAGLREPRSTFEVAGSGQREVTTFVRV